MQELAVDALDLHPLNTVAAERPLGTEVDAWFMALDGRVARMGGDLVIVRVTGIHVTDELLWIQVSLSDDSPGIVVQARAHHTLEDVLDALSDYSLQGAPLEIIRVDSDTAR